MINLNKDQLLQVQKNMPPYLMIDKGINIVPGISAESIKELTNDEWFFKCHFPGDPNMPGMLQLEAMSQTAALAILTKPDNKGKIIYIARANNIFFKKKILPGDTLHIKTNLIKWKRGLGKTICKGFVNNEIACSAEFDLVLNSELNNFRVK